jgi:3',5'-nucleoside bisphosphate phosphatase
MSRADLHLHTTCSDGTLAPGEVVRLARRRGLQAVALTDHDSIDGLEEAREVGRAEGVEVMSGVELSAHVQDREVHLLGYAFDPDNADLRSNLRRFARERVERVREIVERLNGLGVSVSVDAVLEAAAGGVPGRPHVANALIAAGYVSSTADAFRLFLRDGGPAHVPHPMFEASRAIDLIHAAGGVVALAHPGNWTRESVMMELIDSGLDALEIVHPAHDAVLEAYYREVADRHALLRTGGSDFHGRTLEEQEAVGRHTVPLAWLERIEGRARERHGSGAGGSA